MSDKRKEISVDIRNLIIKLRQEKKSYSEIAKIVTKKRSTVQSIIKKFESFGTVLNKRRSGRPRILNDRDIRTLMKNMKKNPMKSAPELAAELAFDLKKNVHPENVRRILRKHGFHARTPRKKPLISSINQHKRLNFALTYKDKDFNFWKKVLFVDESKFNIFRSDGKCKVWRKANKELEKENIITTVKHGGGGVMVWGSMAASGVGELVFIEKNMNASMYLNILRHDLLRSVRSLHLAKDWILLQDNDPKHKSKIVMNWLKKNVPTVLPFPPQSPDLNVIEHLWEELDRRLRKPEVSVAITNENALKKALKKNWTEITSAITENLVISMPRRLQAVIDAKGGPTKY